MTLYLINGVLRESTPGNPVLADEVTPGTLVRVAGEIFRYIGRTTSPIYMNDWDRASPEEANIFKTYLLIAGKE